MTGMGFDRRELKVIERLAIDQLLEVALPPASLVR
jgi:hypothetical protein